MNSLDLNNICVTLHSISAKYTLFSNTPGTFLKTDHIMVHKTKFNTCKNYSSYLVFFYRVRIQLSLLFRHSVLSIYLRLHGLQHTSLPCPSPSPGVWSHTCPLNPWCYPAILSSAIHFSSCLQSFPESGTFQVSQFFTLGGQSVGASASASVLPMNIRGSFHWFDLLAVQGILKSLLQHHIWKTSILLCSAWFLSSNSHICTWLLGKK